MSTGPRIYIDNSCYHIIARGNRKQDVFLHSDDYYKYIMMLKKYKKRYTFKVYGYCLMPNHVHIIGQVGKAVCLSKLIHNVHRAYASYFNYKYDKVGHLWQGRFKSKIIIKDKYFDNCLSYIELNPVRCNIVSAPNEYDWSSYRERCMMGPHHYVLDSFGL